MSNGNADTNNSSATGESAKKKKKRNKKKKAVADGQSVVPAGGSASKDATVASAKKKRRGQKNKNSGPAANVSALSNFFSQQGAHKPSAQKPSAQKPMGKRLTAQQQAKVYSDERLKAYGINPSQYNRMLKKQKYKDFDKKKT